MPPRRSAINRNIRSRPGHPGPSVGDERPPRIRRFGFLLGWIAIAGGCWLIALPHIGNLPQVRGLIQRNESLGIDPSAKFYTELPGMARIVDQVRDARRRDARTSTTAIPQLPAIPPP